MSNEGKCIGGDSNDANKLLSNAIRSLDTIRDRMEEELRKLSDNPEIFDVVQAMTDAYMICLYYLHSYQSAIDGFGREHQMEKVYHRLQIDIRSKFAALTGREYVVDVCRNLEHRRKKQQEIRKKYAQLEKDGISDKKQADISEAQE